jgi:uncharacterized membrane protein SpoIIM required for sporulation
MVIELLENPFSAEKKPWHLFFIGALYSTIAIFLSNWIFKEHASMLMVFLIVIACVPLLYRTLKVEEKKDTLMSGGERRLLKEHAKAISFMTFLFLGCTLTLAIWYIVLPADTVYNSFDAQASTIRTINTQITGNSVTGDAVGLQAFTTILLNNLKVLIFCVLFSFLYGAGAIFILIWNASVISVAIGNYIRINLANVAGELGFHNLASYLGIIYMGVFRYMFHGIPEVLAYFVGAIAGGIIYVAVINEKFGTKQFEKVVLDSSDLILISVAILVVAAALEVYVTPVLFH